MEAIRQQRSPSNASNLSQIYTQWLQRHIDMAAKGLKKLILMGSSLGRASVGICLMCLVGNPALSALFILNFDHRYALGEHNFIISHGKRKLYKPRLLRGFNENAQGHLL